MKAWEEQQKQAWEEKRAHYIKMGEAKHLKDWQNAESRRQGLRWQPNSAYLEKPKMKDPTAYVGTKGKIKNWQDKSAEWDLEKATAHKEDNKDDAHHEPSSSSGLQDNKEAWKNDGGVTFGSFHWESWMKPQFATGAHCDRRDTRPCSR